MNKENEVMTVSGSTIQVSHERSHTPECPPTVTVTEHLFPAVEYFSYYGPSGDVVFELKDGKVVVTTTIDHARHSGRSPMTVVTGAECIVRTDFEALEGAERVAKLKATLVP